MDNADPFAHIANDARVQEVSASTLSRLRRQRIGTAVLQTLLAMHHAKGIDAHVAYVAQANESARWLIEQAGFVRTMSEPDEHGYLEFQCIYPVEERG